MTRDDAGEEIAAADLLGHDPELDRALVQRAIQRTVHGAGVASMAMAALAIAFLTLAGGRLSAQSLPQLALLGSGWVIGAACTLLAWRAGTDLRAGSLGPRAAAGRTARVLNVAVAALPVTALVLAAGLIAAIEPRGTTAVSVVVSLAILSQLVLVLMSVRGGLRRALRRIR